MEKNCLNCLYEPDWGEWVGKEYKRQVGKCKFILKLPAVPAVYHIIKDSISRYSDNSGIMRQCGAWKAKMPSARCLECGEPNGKHLPGCKMPKIDSDSGRYI